MVPISESFTDESYQIFQQEIWSVQDRSFDKLLQPDKKKVCVVLSWKIFDELMVKWSITRQESRAYDVELLGYEYKYWTANCVHVCPINIHLYLKVELEKTSFGGISKLIDKSRKKSFYPPIVNPLFETSIILLISSLNIWFIGRMQFVVTTYSQLMWWFVSGEFIPFLLQEYQPDASTSQNHE